MTERAFDDLVAEAGTASVAGWDFSWLDDRATEQRPSWGYQRLMAERLGRARAALDIETGGGEVLAGAARFPPTMAATESWPPNIAKATRLLHPRGAVVVDGHRDRLRELDARIRRDGVFTAHSSRTLIEARKPS
jgi:hypothetical protein